MSNINKMVNEINQSCYHGRTIAYFDGRLIQCPGIVQTITTEVDTTETIANDFAVDPDWIEVNRLCLTYMR